MFGRHSLPRLLALLCLAAALTPGAHADTLLDFTFYLGGYVDPGTTLPADLPPPADGVYQTVRFTLPTSPNVPPVTLCTGPFCPYPDGGFMIAGVPIAIQDYPPPVFPPVTVGPPVYTTANIFFGDGITSIQGANGFLFLAHDFFQYTLSPTLEPTFILDNQYGSVLDFYARGSPVAFATEIPEAASTSPVPEPATITLLATGALSALAARRKPRSS